MLNCEITLIPKLLTLTALLVTVSFDFVLLESQMEKRKVSAISSEAA